MPLTTEINEWLRTAGYEYHCFISWAHTQNEEMTECAQRLKGAIENDLSLSVPNPRVFIDEVGIRAGADWQETLRQALCQSISMVAICAPIYFDKSHQWCGLEWAAMDLLGEMRLNNQQFRSIIPVVLRIPDPMPAPLSEIQYVNISRVMIAGRRYYSTQEFRLKIRDIINRIEQIAHAIITNRSVANCDQFIFPERSAFIGYQRGSLPFPFRSQ